MSATDAQALAALETQLRELTGVFDSLARARNTLVPAPATFWHGDARNRYDELVSDIAAQADDTLDLLRLALQSTMLALTEEAHRA